MLLIFSVLIALVRRQECCVAWCILLLHWYAWRPLWCWLILCWLSKNWPSRCVCYAPPPSYGGGIKQFCDTSIRLPVSDSSHSPFTRWRYARFTISNASEWGSTVGYAGIQILLVGVGHIIALLCNTFLHGCCEMHSVTTLCLKKTSHLETVSNFVKSWSIFEIFALLESVWNLL